MERIIRSGLIMGFCEEFWTNLFKMPNRPVPGVTTGGAATAATSGATAGATQPADAAADEDGNIEGVEEVCQSCENKWLIITVTRHTKVTFTRTGTRKDRNGVSREYEYEYWDCTLGDMKMEVCDTQDAESGDLIFSCHTVERGAEGGARKQRTAESKRMIHADDVHGVNIHNRTRIKTYKYVRQNAAYNLRPRAGLGVYGNGFSVVSGTRTGVAIHHGSTNTWSVGCILLTNEVGAKSGGRWRFGIAQSYQTLLMFRQKLLMFCAMTTARQPATVPPDQRLQRVKLKIVETFE